jgi:hypothetical protein
MMLLYAEPANAPHPGEPVWEGLMQEWTRFLDEANKAGVYQGGGALHPVTTATTMRPGTSGPLLSDGPFAETKEQLGGFSILECKDLDEATAWAARIPSLRFGSVEIRPIMDMS